MGTNTLEIVPFVGIDHLRFGESRQEIRKRLNHAHRAFRKGSFASNDTDAYDALGLHLYYDSADGLEFVEMFTPSNPTLQGLPLLGRGLVEVAGDLEKLGYFIEFTDIGLNCTTVGVALTAVDDIIEGVAIYREGYYDDTN